jgi:hypothetical protein
MTTYEAAQKGLLENCKTKERFQLSPQVLFCS